MRIKDANVPWKVILYMRSRHVAPMGDADIAEPSARCGLRALEATLGWLIGVESHSSLAFHQI